MEAMPKKLKNSSGQYILPVTHSDLVHVDGNGTTLTNKITSLENRIGSGSGGGNSPSLPEGVIDPRNIQYAEVVQEATGNLFDLRTVIEEGYFDQPSGLWRYDGSYSSSALIKVSPSTQYTTKHSVITTFWNSNKGYVSFTRDKTFTTPSNVAYVRLAIGKANVVSEMFVKGSSAPTTYAPYGEYPTYKLPSEIFVTEPQVKGVAVKHLSDEVKGYIETEIQESDRLERARGKVNLFIETAYDGYNQPIHPKILYFANGWNGYKYWMASTPFPYALDAAENPHIHASNDMLNWIVPSGLINPIDDLTDGSQDYWSDTHLVYRPDLNRLECWYRGVVDGSSTPITIAMKYSTDGVTWSQRQIMWTSSINGILSHSIIWDTNKYKIWVFGSGQGYYETSDGKNWLKISDISHDKGAFPVWHADVEKTDIGYEMVVQPVTNNCPTIDHYTSVDGITWSNKKVLMLKSSLGIDAGGFYRACLLKIDGIYYVFPSTISSSGERGITLSIATEQNNILSLKGIDSSYIPYMNAPTKKPKGGIAGEIIFDKTLNKAIICTTPGRNAVWKDFNGTIV